MRGKSSSPEEAEEAGWKANIGAEGFNRQMLVYPLAYVLLILPLLISQFSAMAGHKVSFGTHVFCAVIFLLSGPVNAFLFFVICPVLPSGSLRLGQQSSELSSQDQERNQDGDLAQASGHRRTTSDSSNDTLVGAAKKNKMRPPDIIITRDSIDSVYSVYEAEEPGEVSNAVLHKNVSHSAPPGTYWSPESPRRRTAHLLV